MRRKAATAALKGIVSRDPLEGMLAAQLLATHKAAIGSFHHANPRPSREPGHQERGPRQTKERSCLAITAVLTPPRKSPGNARHQPRSAHAAGRDRDFPRHSRDRRAAPAVYLMAAVTATPGRPRPWPPRPSRTGGAGPAGSPRARGPGPAP